MVVYNLIAHDFTGTLSLVKWHYALVTSSFCASSRFIVKPVFVCMNFPQYSVVCPCPSFPEPDRLWKTLRISAARWLCTKRWRVIIFLEHALANALGYQEESIVEIDNTYQIIKQANEIKSMPTRITAPAEPPRKAYHNASVSRVGQSLNVTSPPVVSSSGLLLIPFMYTYYYLFCFVYLLHF